MNASVLGLKVGLTPQLYVCVKAINKGWFTISIEKLVGLMLIAEIVQMTVTVNVLAMLGMPE